MNPLVWITDASVQGSIDEGHLQIATQSGVQVERAPGSSLHVTLGDTMAYMGDWHKPGDDWSSPASTVVVCKYDTLVGTWADVKTYLEHYQYALTLYMDVDADPVEANYEMGVALNNLQTLFPLYPGNCVGDHSQVRFTQSPYGGTTHKDVQTAFAAIAGNSTKPLTWHPYTVMADLPIMGSSVVHDGSGNAQIILQTGGDQDLIGFNGLITGTPVYLADPMYVAENQGVDPVTGTDIGFPLFVYYSSTLGDYKMCLYQPHLAADGDMMSAKVMVHAGNTYSDVGFLTSGVSGSTAITSAGMPIGLPAGDNNNEFWVSDYNDALVGSYGIPGSSRPLHDMVMLKHPTTEAAMVSSKTQGYAGISLWQLGPSYGSMANPEIPLGPADWGVTGFHGNLRDKQFYQSLYSLGNSVALTGTTPTIEACAFQFAFGTVQWEDEGGQGLQAIGTPDLKGYRYEPSADVDLPVAAQVDSAKAIGGTKLTTLLRVPTLGKATKLWELNSTSNGLSLVAGRFGSMTTGVKSVVTEYKGPYFLGAPKFTANMYMNWMTDDVTDVLPRFTLRIRG